MAGTEVAVAEPRKIERADGQTVEIITINAADAYLAVERLDKEELEVVSREVHSRRIYPTRGGGMALSADSVDACLAARESDSDLGVDMQLPQVELFREDPEDKKTWMWIADIRGANYNTKTGVRSGNTVGTGENPYNQERIVVLERDKKTGKATKTETVITDDPDPFGRRKAIRIAQKKVKMLCLGDMRLKEWEVRERRFLNASRKVTPADAARIEESRATMGVAQGEADAAQPSEKQLSFARMLTEKGHMTEAYEGKTKAEVSKLIDEAVKRRDGKA